MGSDFGILDVDRRELECSDGMEEWYGDSGASAGIPPPELKDMSLSGDSSDFIGELESVCLGLRVPVSLGALDPDSGAL